MSSGITPLIPGGLVSEKDYELLRGLSVTAVEDLLGLIAADPEAVQGFLPGLDLPQVQADAQSFVEAPALAGIDELSGAEFALGAWAPEGVEVEAAASPEYVMSWLDEARASESLPAEAQPPGADLVDCFGDVRNQEKRGTCVAHAVCAVLECQRRRLFGVDEDLSEQFAYWWAKQNDGYPQQPGTQLKIAVPGAESDGICLEHVWPYNPVNTPGNEGQGPPPDGATADAGGRLLEQPRDLGGRDADAIRRSLDAGRPVAIAVPVYNNWYANGGAHLTGRIPMPLPMSVRKGGHAVCVAGYGYDSQFAGGGFFAVRNSWGTGWAPRSGVKPGYGAIPFLYIEKYGWEAWTAR